MIKHHQSGLAMVIVIWVLTLLTIMAGSFSLTMRRETVVISASKNNAEAFAVAESGAIIAQEMLLHKDNSLRWNANGSIYPFQLQGINIRVRLFSENGKVDINKANAALLMTLITSINKNNVEKNQQIVSAIIDWRDKDDLIQIDGAEELQYEEAGLAYSPANKPFQIKDELQMVLGMKPALYEKLEPLITVYSGKASVDMNLASTEVLQALNQSETIIIEEEENTNEIDAKNQQQSNSNKIMESRGNSNKNVYTIISEAKLFDDFGVAIKMTVAKLAGASATPFQVLEYQQLYQGVSLFSDEMDQFLVEPQDESE